MRKKLAQVLGTCLVLAIFVAIVLCHQPDRPAGANTARFHDETVTKSISLVLDRYATAMVSGDVEGWLALWDEQAARAPFGETPGVGGACIECSVRRRLDKHPPSGMSISVRDVSTEGDIAVATGEFTQSADAAAEEASTEGTFLTVFRRHEDGSWKILQSCFNSIDLRAPDSSHA